jgi:predicted amidohydrolase YtcJ
VLNPILAPGHQATVSSVESFTRLGLMTGFGDAWLRFGSLKLFLDGAGCAGLHHAQLSGPARGWGLQNFLYGELVRILAACRDAGVHVWMHAVGDAAHSLGIDAVEEVNLACGNGDHRTRIEHIPRATADFSVFARLRRAGIVPVPTAAFMHFEPDDRETSLPPGGRLFPYRTLIASGLLPPGNSDTAGTQPFAANPWHGVALMQLRRNRNGVEFARDEAVGTAESVRTYTRNGAYAGFEEHLKGSLEPGKLGDLAVYADDPYALDAEELLELEADLTVVSGRVVYRRGAGATPPP